VQKPDVRVEPHQARRDGDIFGEHRVAERQQRVDRVFRWSAVAGREVEGAQLVVLEQASEALEVEPGRVALEPHQHLERGSRRCALDELSQLEQHAGLEALEVASQKGSRVGDLGGHELSRQPQRFPGFERPLVLCPP